MASPGGTSSNSSSLQQNSSSEEDMNIQIIDERKRKRMMSNRESARRSRMRKQKHLNDLMAQVGNLRKSNNQILNSINITTQHFLKVEAENSILRAQMSELSNRLQAINDINNAINSTGNCSSSNNTNATTNNIINHQGLGIYGEEFFPNVQDYLMNPWNAVGSCMNQPIMASADMFQY